VIQIIMKLTVRDEEHVSCTFGVEDDSVDISIVPIFGLDM